MCWRQSDALGIPRRQPVIVATNHDYLLDPALWRRFDEVVASPTAHRQAVRQDAASAPPGATSRLCRRRRRRAGTSRPAAPRPGEGGRGTPFGWRCSTAAIASSPRSRRAIERVRRRLATERRSRAA